MTINEGAAMKLTLNQRENPYQMAHAPGREELPGEEELTFPKMVVINTAFPCNALCPHCPYTNSSIRKEPRAKTTPFIPEHVFKIIADEVGEHGAILRFTGGGEPLLHKKLLDYVAYAKQVGCQVGLITNGSLMTEEKAARLLDCGIEMIEFSVDAADRETYAIVRKGLDFDKTLANVKRTVALRNQKKAGTKIIASVVNQKIVADKIEQIVDFWEKIVDAVQVRKYLTFDINDLENSGNLIPYLEPSAPCPFPFDRVLIDTSGDIRFCNYDIKARTNWGNVLKASIASVWKGERFRWLREIHRNGEYFKMRICANCLDRQFRSWKYNYYYLKEKAATKR